LIEYAELHCHSAYSLLDGASMPEALVDRARALELRGLALTDHDDLGAAVRFSQHALPNDAHPEAFPAILGLELTLAGSGTQADSHLTLLAQTREGYANLSRLVTHARHTPPRGSPRTALDTLAQHTTGVLCLSGCPRGAIPRQLAQGDHLGARRLAGQLRDLFGPQNFAIEVWDHGLPEEARAAHDLIGLARELRSPWVVTNNVHYAEPAGRIVHDALTCLRHHTTLDAAGSHLRPNAEWHLKGAAAMAQRWRHDLTGVRASVALAERCPFRLQHLTPQLPSTTLPPGFTRPDAYLRHLTYGGAQHRWPTITPKHRAQLERELTLIEKKGLSAYFLIMWQIVQFAQSQHILVQGRGSAANSAVCYCLGITAVDPIKHTLLFERFLSEARDGYPDIDLDIAHTRREEILQWVYQHYGRPHAAMVCEHICFRGRSAARDAARVLGFSPDEGARLAENVGRGDLTAEHIQAAGFDPSTPRLQALQRTFDGLNNLPRHRSIHVGGFVLSAQPIQEIVPIEPAAMEGRTIIQWDKDDLKAAGLPKFDLLGLGMLTALAEALQLVNQHRRTPLTLYNLPDDPATYDMIGRADTVGVFQIESRAQMNCLPRTQPRTLYELAIQVALIRPGPLQGDMVHPYIRRKRGEEPIELFHPAVEPILKRTLGVPLFQEQGMQLSVAVGGFTATEADALRCAMGSQRHRHTLSDLTQKLFDGLSHAGVDADTAQRIVRQIEGFSTYGFPESHSTSFALLAYASSWLKCNHPAEFLCALLNAQPMGFYTPAALIHDAKRHSVHVLPPCLQHSHWLSTVQYTPGQGPAVRLGLRLIRGLPPSTRRTLQAARDDAPFTSPTDVLRRTQLPDAALTQLAESGSFRAWYPNRRRAIWQVLHLARHASHALPLVAPADPFIQLPLLLDVDQTRADYRTLGLTTGHHPMHWLRPKLQSPATYAADLATHRPGWIRTAGQVTTRQRPPSAKGFFFLTIEDESGFINVIVPPKIYEQNRRVLVQSDFLWVEGVLVKEQGVCNIKGRRFRPLHFEGLAAPRSYDFH
jgi:error-prone DNA polymerase